MKATHIFYIAFLLMMASCRSKNEKTSDTGNDTSTVENTIYRSKYDTEKLVGEYIGIFGKNTLILDITYVNNNNASGFNIVKGNRRNLKGSVEDQGDQFKFVLNEPGSDKYDGVFEFTVDTATLTAKGKWTPNDKELAGKEFSLKKRSETGQPEGYSGTWFLTDCTINLKTDGTGTANGAYEDKNGEWVTTDFKCTWIDNGNGITIEWSKNPVFKMSVMKFTKGTKEYGEEYLVCKEYEMYRYW